MNKRILLIALFLLFAGFQPVVQALGLGELELKSHLNQKLKVLIPLISLQESEIPDLKVTIAKAEESSSRLQTWYSLKVEIVEDDGDQPYLKITSKKALREPALRFIVDISWSGGHMQRAYSLILDPKP